MKADERSANFQIGAFQSGMFRAGSETGAQCAFWLAAQRCVIALLLTVSSFNVVHAQSPDDFPELRPPRGEIPPGFWMEHGWQVIVGGALALLILGVLTWLLFRPKAKSPIPPEIKARRELESLRGALEDGAALSRISRIVRTYFAEAFRFPPGELTTSEFCQMVAASNGIGDDLAAELTAFLRRCDEQKFAPGAVQPDMHFFSEALALVERGESRRAELRRIAAASASASNRPS